jgi:hypothetical protein
MKEIIIAPKRIKKELYSLLVCFVVANLLNIYAIITYQTAIAELLSMLGYVTVFAVVLYLLWTIIRIIFYLIRTILKSKKNTTVK